MGNPTDREQKQHMDSLCAHAKSATPAEARVDTGVTTTWGGGRPNISLTPKRNHRCGTNPRTSKSTASADRRSHATSQNSVARNPTAHQMSCTAAEHQGPVHVVPLVDDRQLGHATAMSTQQMHNQQLPLPASAARGPIACTQLR